MVAPGECGHILGEWSPGWSRTDVQTPPGQLALGLTETERKEEEEQGGGKEERKKDWREKRK